MSDRVVFVFPHQGPLQARLVALDPQSAEYRAGARYALKNTTRRDGGVVLAYLNPQELDDLGQAITTEIFR